MFIQDRCNLCKINEYEIHNVMNIFNETVSKEPYVLFSFSTCLTILIIV